MDKALAHWLRSTFDLEELPDELTGSPPPGPGVHLTFFPNHCFWRERCDICGGIFEAGVLLIRACNMGEEHAYACDTNQSII